MIRHYLGVPFVALGAVLLFLGIAITDGLTEAKSALTFLTSYPGDNDHE